MIRGAALALIALLVAGCAKQVTTYPGEVIGVAYVTLNGDLSSGNVLGRYPDAATCEQGVRQIIAGRIDELGPPPKGVSVLMACLPESQFTVAVEGSDAGDQ